MFYCRFLSVESGLKYLSHRKYLTVLMDQWRTVSLLIGPVHNAHCSRCVLFSDLSVVVLFGLGTNYVDLQLVVFTFIVLMLIHPMNWPLDLSCCWTRVLLFFTFLVIAMYRQSLKCPLAKYGIYSGVESKFKLLFP